MTKTELICCIASEAGVTKKVAESVFNATLNQVQKAVSEGEKIVLAGFGTFEPKVQEQREGRNPATGESIIIPKKRVPRFSPGKGFREMVNF